MLNPFTNYVVTVSASTSVGFGPQSSQLTFTTDEDGTVNRAAKDSNFVLIFELRSMCK